MSVGRTCSGVLTILVGLAFALIVIRSAEHVEAQGQESAILEKFLKSRPVTRDGATGPESVKKPDPQSGNGTASGRANTEACPLCTAGGTDPSGARGAGSKGGTTAASRKVATNSAVRAGAADRDATVTEVPRGLGVTAFVGEGDSQRRVNSGEKLKNSDHVRLLVETAATGYLYAFQQRDDGLAEMIFPEPTPLGSAHLVQAYQLTEIPVRGWLQFGDKASSEHIHLVLAATPLTDADVTLHVHSTSEGPQPRKAPIARHLEREKLERLQAAGAPFSTDEGGEYGMRRTGQEEAGKYLLDIDARPHLIVMVAPGPHLRDWIVATVAIDHR